MIVDVAFGIAGTLTMEFLLAHAWIWYEGGGSKTVTNVEADAVAVKDGVMTFEKLVINDVKSVGNTVVAEKDRVEQFFGDWMHKNTAPVSTQTATPAVQASPAPSTPPTTSSGGTPVPSVSL